MKTKGSKMHKGNRAAHSSFGGHTSKKHYSKQKKPPTSPRIVQQQQQQPNGKSTLLGMLSVKNPFVFPLTRGKVINQNLTSLRQQFNDFTVQQSLHQKQVIKSIQQPIQQSKV